MSKTVKEIKSKIEHTIVDLTKQRNLIDEELQVLVKMIGVDAPKPKARKSFTKKPKGTAVEVVRKLASTGQELTAPIVAEKTGVTTTAAASALAKLTEDKELKRKARGVYVARGKS